MSHHDSLPEYSLEDANAHETVGDTQDQSEGAFVPNADLNAQETIKLIPAPSDRGVCEEYQSDDNPGVCFACVYGGRNDGKSSQAWNTEDISNAYDDMFRMIRANISKNTQNSVLVDMVHEFYEKEIRRTHDYGEWKKSCIYQHIFFHTIDEDVHMQEMTSTLFAQIQSLRSKLWQKNEDTNSIEPHHKNIYLLEKLIKSYGDHITKKKNKNIK